MLNRNQTKQPITAQQTANAKKLSKVKSASGVVTGTMQDQLNLVSGTPLGGLLSTDMPLTAQERNALQVSMGFRQGAYTGPQMSMDQSNEMIEKAAQDRIDALKKKRGTYSAFEAVDQSKKAKNKTPTPVNFQTPLISTPTMGNTTLGGSKNVVGK